MRLVRVCVLRQLQVAVTDVVEAVKDADILVFVLPHQVRPRQAGYTLLVSPWLSELFHITCVHVRVSCRSL